MFDPSSPVTFSPSLVKEQWLSPDMAVREVVAFERRFGSKHLLLACHAALPLFLTPELLNLIHINFLDSENISWIAEADFLLSPLCRMMGEGLFEVEPGVREVLLVELENQTNWQRPFELADFLQMYLVKKPDWKQSPGITRIQWWIAQAYIDPDGVIEEMTELLEKSLPSEKEHPIDLPNLIQIATTLEVVGDPLERANSRSAHQYLVNNSQMLAQLLYRNEDVLKASVPQQGLDDESEKSLTTLISPAMLEWITALDPGKHYLQKASQSSVTVGASKENLLSDELHQEDLKSPPELVPSVVKTIWLVKDQQRECHIEIVNKGESPAHEVKVRILPSEVGDYVDDLRLYSVPGGRIYSHPHSITITVPVTLSPTAAEKDAVNLLVVIEYIDRENRKRETAPIRLHVPLRDEIQFIPIKNPYQTGRPITELKLLFGRNEIIDDLAQGVTRHELTSIMAIYGQLRSGKTSILRNLESYLSAFKSDALSLVIPIYFSMYNVLSSTNETEITSTIFYLIAEEIANRCKKIGLGDQVGDLTWEQLISPPGPTLQFRMYLDRVRKLRGTRVVLLIDDFPELAATIDQGQVDPSFMKYFKSLVEQGFFSCVISGNDNMPQVLKKYSNQLALSEVRLIGYLAHDAAAELIEDPIRLPNGISRFASPRVVDELIRLTGGSPYYIQFMCDRLVQFMNSIQSPIVTEADVDRVIVSLISGPAAIDPYTKFYNLSRYSGDETRDTRETTIEGLFLYLLADETRNRPFAPFSAIQERASFVNEPELLTIVEQLEERQVIERSGGRSRSYRIVVDLFRRWINAKRPMDTRALDEFRRKLEKMET